MRRRLSLTMVLMVVGALVFAGLVTAGLSAAANVRQTESQLVVQGRQLADGLRNETQVTLTRPTPTFPLRTVLRVLKGTLRLQGAEVLAIRKGALYDLAEPSRPVTLPRGLAADDVDVAALASGIAEKGHVGRLTWAAVPFGGTVRLGSASHSRVVAVRQVVILTRAAPSAPRVPLGWFTLAALATVALALVVANRLGHRIVRPLEAAQAVTGRIAAGDLGARLATPPGGDPELVALARSINSMAAGLARSHGLQRQFLLSVSHELRTPLTSIRGYAEALTEGAMSDPARAASVIASEARRLERLVGDLLELGKLESGGFNLRALPIELSEVVEDTVDAFGPTADHLGLQLAAQLHPGVVATVDPDRLAQVLANLIENAIKFATGKVTVGLEAAMDGAVVWVADDGPGIPSDDLPRVFERLYQSRQNTGRHVGSGLGLAIVAQLVTAMGGAVRAESPIGPEGGTRMEVHLPAAAAAVAG